MITIEAFFLSFLFTMIIVCLVTVIIIWTNPCNFYNRIFNRKNYNLWRYFIANAGKFEYSHTYRKTVYYGAVIDGIKYEAIIWGNVMYNGVRLTSIHKFKSADDICGECLLSPFDRESSATMTKALKNFNN